MARERFVNYMIGRLLCACLILFCFLCPDTGAGAQTRENMSDFSDEMSKYFEPSGKTNEEKDKMVAKNMRDAQRAAELYACFHDGRYPTKVDDDFKRLFHGNTVYDLPSALSSFVNPFSGARFWPELGTLKQPLLARQSQPFPLPKGIIRYCPIDKGKNYAIVGGGSGGYALRGAIGGHSTSKTYVLTKDPVTITIANMRFMQIILSRYSQDHQFLFPRTMDAEFKSYFPGGNRQTGASGKPPINPYTGQREWPLATKFMDSKLARRQPPGPLAPGKLEYASSPTRTRYIVRGGGPNGRALAGPDVNGTLIYGRDGDGTE
jgi:hypothetical protein